MMSIATSAPPTWAMAIQQFEDLKRASQDPSVPKPVLKGQLLRFKSILDTLIQTSENNSPKQIEAYRKKRIVQLGLLSAAGLILMHSAYMTSDSNSKATPVSALCCAVGVVIVLLSAGFELKKIHDYHERLKQLSELKALSEQLVSKKGS